MKIFLQFSCAQDNVALTVSDDDTVKVLRDEAWSVLQKVDASFREGFYLVFNGKVLVDPDMELSTLQFNDNLVVHAVKPLRASIPGGSDIKDCLPKIFDLPTHCDPRTEQKNFDTKDLFAHFCDWVGSPEGLSSWKPEEAHWETVQKCVQEMQTNAHPCFGGGRHVKFYGEYGCALLSVVGHPNEMVHLALVCLDDWELSVHMGQSRRFHAAKSKPEKPKTLHVGFVKSSAFEGFLSRTDDFLKVAKARKGSKRSAGANGQGHQKTPDFVKAVMEDALKEIKSGTQKKEGTSSPTGGFTDVGVHTGGKNRDTAWPIVQAVLWEMAQLEDFLHEAFCEFRLWLVEIASYSCYIGFSWGQDIFRLRALLDKAKLALKETALKAADSPRSVSYRFEARCALVDHMLLEIQTHAAKRHSKMFQLKPYKMDDFVIEPFTISLPALKEPEGKQLTVEDRKQLASQNLGALPIPACLRMDQNDNPHPNSWSFSPGIIKDMVKWLKSPSLVSSLETKGDRGREASFLVCRTVENAIFSMAVNSLDPDEMAETSLGELSVNLQAIVDVYRTAAKTLHTDDLCVLSVESQSREVLLLWSTYCLVHCAVLSMFQTVGEYTPALKPEDLEHLSLSDRLAVDALRSVASYLKTFPDNRYIFSLRTGDLTFDFAREFARQNLHSVWEKEKAKADVRKLRHWQQIQQKQQQLRQLDFKLSNLRESLAEWELELSRTEIPQYSRWHQTTEDNDKRYHEATDKVQSYQSRIYSTESKVRESERPPKPIYQPLPENEGSALPIVFFLFMPVEFQVLSWLSFVSQQILLPPTGALKETIGRPKPITLLREHYLSYSGETAASTDVIIGSSSSMPSRRNWYPNNVREYYEQSQGVWYPDSLTPTLHWSGGRCDSRSDVNFFNPFINCDRKALVERFTERLKGENTIIQWALPQDGEHAGESRGSWPQVTQNTKHTLNSDKLGWMAFGLLRAYPQQQLRKICAILKGRVMPLEQEAVRTLILQTLYHVGPLNEAGDLTWKLDTTELDGWPTMEQELRSFGDEIRTKVREHGSLLVLGLIAAHASEWDEGCKHVSRVLAKIARKWGDELSEAIPTSDPLEVPEMRARCCIFYMYSILCYGGTWTKDDVSEVCDLVVLATYYRVFDDHVSLWSMANTLTSYTRDFMSRNLFQVLKLVDVNVLTRAINVGLGSSYSNLRWRKYSETPRFEAVTVSGSLVTLNVLNGIVLLDGLPPRRLPVSITQSAKYMRSFGNRNFDVVEDSGVLTTTRDILGRRYSFFQTSGVEVIIREVGINGKDSLELLDGTDDGVELWGGNIPIRLKRMHSHWFCRQRNVVLLRPVNYQEREIEYILSPRVFPNVQEDGWYCRWHCSRVPSNQRGLQMEKLLELNSDFDKLVSLREKRSNILRVLGRFEQDPGLIHFVITGAGQLAFEIPRYGIEFELDREGGDIRSKNFKGFTLSREQQLTDTLYGFEHYLTLDSPSSPTMLLVPAGRVSKNDDDSVVVNLEGKYDSNLSFYRYEIHARFESIDPTPGKSALAGRLQLAVLYAATGSSILELRSQQTGGERAVELLRQSYVNRPLSETEAAQLRSLRSLSGNTPSVALLCYELELSSKELYFLYDDNMETTDMDVSYNRGAADEYLELKKKGHLSSRALMTTEEEKRVLNRIACQDQSRITEVVGDMRDGAVLSSRTAFQKLLHRLQSFVTTTSSAIQSSTFPLSLEGVCSNTIGHEIMTGLKRSWGRHIGQPKERVSRESTAISAILSTTTSLRTELQLGLLAALSHIPSQTTEKGLCFSLRRTAGVELNISLRDLPCCAMVRSFLRNLNPFLSEDDKEDVHRGILHWLELCVLEDKLERMVAALKECNQLQFERELDTIQRHWSVRDFPGWLVFEVEQRLQIRQVQYEVAQFCINNPGKITQLNMGEGKTRVILPMLLIYFAPTKSVTRLHFLSPLLGEAYDYLHKTLTSSFLSTKLFLLPFQRDVRLDLQRTRAIQECTRRCNRVGGALIVAPEHRLSLHLKRIEGGTPVEVQTILEQVEDEVYIDIFDESDEILHHKYQLIYAVGGCMNLPAATSRWAAIQAVLNVIQCNSEVRRILSNVGSTIETAKTEYGGAFDHIRLIPGPDLNSAKHSLLSAIAEGVCEDPPYHMRWLRTHPSRVLIEEFVVDPSRSLEWFLRANQTSSKANALDQVLTLRGLLAGDLLEHCMYRRFRVDYGVDRRRGMKRRIAVPYRACDSPAERAEYAHPDVIILLTILSYYYDGLSLAETKEAIVALLRSGPVNQEKEYFLWLEPARQTLDSHELDAVDMVSKLDPTNEAQLSLLHKVFSHNMGIVNYWLDTCVLPTETMQFPQRLSANACHLASNKGSCCGFSGTKDNYLLLPPQVTQVVPDNVDTLVATDGKMIDLMLKSESVERLPSLEDNSSSIAQEVLKLAIGEGVNAIIDAGASMAGLNNSQVADRLIRLTLEKQKGGGGSCRGIVYFDITENTWKVKGLEGRTWHLGNSPIKESEALVFFDESRCRGADMKLLDNATALLTLSLGMCKDKLMQAAGRMRKLEFGQSLTFVVPDEVARKICTENGEDLSTRAILEWVIENTVDDIASSLPEWATQASYFATTRENPKSRNMDEVLAVEDLYGDAVASGNVNEFVERITERDVARVERMGVQQDESSLELLRHVKAHATQYGSDQAVSLSKNNEECERELENERELEREVEVEIPRQIPRPCRPWELQSLFSVEKPESLPREAKVSTLANAVATRYIFGDATLSNIEWDSRIFVTKNFIETVRSMERGRLDDLSNYMRPVDGLMLFVEPGQPEVSSACLLLSEWEADMLLPLARQYGNNRPDGGCVHNVFVNFAYLVEAADGAWATPTKLQIPDTTKPVKVCDEVMVCLQLFAGDTTYRTAGRKRALQTLLSEQSAKRAAEEMVKLRGRGNYIARSDLEEVCELDMLDEA